MNVDMIPISVLFGATILLVMIAIEGGYRLGRIAHRHSGENKDSESSVSAIEASVLGLTAFMLAFTFGIVSDRYDTRKGLVLAEANAIGTAYLRADFMSEPDRSKTRALYREYLASRIAVVQSSDLDQVQKALIDSDRIQQQLWDMSVANAFKDMNSDVAALYVDSLNQVIDIHAMRVTVGLQARIPLGIWLVLFLLVILGMIVVGYQAAITNSSRSPWVTSILALSFSLVIALIASLERPNSRFIPVSQQPLMNLQATMAAGVASNP